MSLVTDRRNNPILSGVAISTNRLGHKFAVTAVSFTILFVKSKVF